MFLKEHTGGHLYNFGVNRVFLHTLIHRAQPKKNPQKQQRRREIRYIKIQKLGHQK